MLFWPGDGKIDQHHALAGLLFGQHAVEQLPHRRVDLGHKGQPLQRSLEEVECLAAQHLRGQPAQHIEHAKRQGDGQHRLHPRLASQSSGKITSIR